jgi:hypothetical protein
MSKISKIFHRSDFLGGNYVCNASGAMHCDNGPAVVYDDGRISWYIHGKKIYTTADYQRAAKLSDEEMTMLVLKYGGVIYGWDMDGKS